MRQSIISTFSAIFGAIVAPNGVTTAVRQTTASVTKPERLDAASNAEEVASASYPVWVAQSPARLQLYGNDIPAVHAFILQRVAPKTEKSIALLAACLTKGRTKRILHKSTVTFM